MSTVNARCRNPPVVMHSCASLASKRVSRSCLPSRPWPARPANMCLSVARSSVWACVSSPSLQSARTCQAIVAWPCRTLARGTHGRSQQHRLLVVAPRRKQGRHCNHFLLVVVGGISSSPYAWHTCFSHVNSSLGVCFSVGWARQVNLSSPSPVTPAQRGIARHVSCGTR
eukprot:COSAG02_NODE_20_length_53673_cov_86.864841_31_plen_170_part_00